MSLQIQETDEAGAHVATYVTSRDGQGTARVDVIVCIAVFVPARGVVVCGIVRLLR